MNPHHHNHHPSATRPGRLRPPHARHPSKPLALCAALAPMPVPPFKYALHAARCLLLLPAPPPHLPPTHTKRLPGAATPTSTRRRAAAATLCQLRAARASAANSLPARERLACRRTTGCFARSCATLIAAPHVPLPWRRRPSRSPHKLPRLTQPSHSAQTCAALAPAPPTPAQRRTSPARGGAHPWGWNQSCPPLGADRCRGGAPKRAPPTHLNGQRPSHHEARAAGSRSQCWCVCMPATAEPPAQPLHNAPHLPHLPCPSPGCCRALLLRTAACGSRAPPCVVRCWVMHAVHSVTALGAAARMRYDVPCDGAVGVQASLKLLCLLQRRRCVPAAQTLREAAAAPAPAPASAASSAAAGWAAAAQALLQRPRAERPQRPTSQTRAARASRRRAPHAPPA